MSVCKLWLVSIFPHISLPNSTTPPIRTWVSLSLVVTGVTLLVAGSWESLGKAGIARTGDATRIWNSSYLVSSIEVEYFNITAIDVAMLKYTG